MDIKERLMSKESAKSRVFKKNRFHPHGLNMSERSLVFDKAFSSFQACPVGLSFRLVFERGLLSSAGEGGGAVLRRSQVAAGERCDVETPGISVVGEPRTVRLIYFIPNDRAYRAEVVQRLKDEIRAIQTFFGDQMEAHGYGNRTFRVETDLQDEPLVHVVNGAEPDSRYIGTRNNAEAVFTEIGPAFNFRSNVYLIVLDNSTERLAGRIDGLGKRYAKAAGSRW